MTLPRTRTLLAACALAALAAAYVTRPSAHVPMTDIWRLLDSDRQRRA